MNDWHNLIKDPRDLPKNRRKVECLIKVSIDHFPEEYHKIEMSYNDHRLPTGNTIGWGVSYPYDFAFGRDSVIAWREVDL